MANPNQGNRERKLPRKVRRRLERERKKHAEKMMKLKEKQAKKMETLKNVAPREPTVADANKAKIKAEESLEELKSRLFELQNRSHHYTGARRNMALDTIPKIIARIGDTEDLIEVYNEWINRQTTIQKLGKDLAEGMVKKNAPK